MSLFGVPLKQDWQPLFAWEWNLLVTAVDSIYLAELATVYGLTSGLAYLNIMSLYVQDGAWFGSEIYVDGYKVLHDMDPIYIADFISGAGQKISTITSYLNTTAWSTSTYLPALPTISSYASALPSIGTIESTYLPALTSISSYTSTLPSISALNSAYLPYLAAIANYTSALPNINTIISNIQSTLSQLQAIVNNIYSLDQQSFSYIQLIYGILSNIYSSVKVYTNIATVHALQITVSSTPTPITSSSMIARRAVVINPASNPYVTYLGDIYYQVVPIAPGGDFEVRYVDLSTVYLTASGSQYVYAYVESLTG